MKAYLFSVFDSKTQVYCAPFVAPTTAAALRDFAYAANDQSITLGKYPEDYTLYSIGEFDDESGVITPQTHKSLGTAIQYVKQIEEFEHV